MVQPIENHQPSQLELPEEVPRIALHQAQKAQLATLVEALLAEIAAALAIKKEAGNEQDHR